MITFIGSLSGGHLHGAATLGERELRVKADAGSNGGR
jgi:hypothetical protein